MLFFPLICCSVFKSKVFSWQMSVKTISKQLNTLNQFLFYCFNKPNNHWAVVPNKCIYIWFVSIRLKIPHKGAICICSLSTFFICISLLVFVNPHIHLPFTYALYFFFHNIYIYTESIWISLLFHSFGFQEKCNWQKILIFSCRVIIKPQTNHQL